VDKSNGKPGRGDLVVKDAQLGGFRNLVVDVVCTHEFGGNHLEDVSLNGQLRDYDHNRLLQNEARKKVERYRDVHVLRACMLALRFLLVPLYRFVLVHACTRISCFRARFTIQ
jgi:hypothetical protein